MTETIHAVIYISLGLVDASKKKDWGPNNILKAVMVVYIAEIAIKTFVWMTSSLCCLKAYITNKTLIKNIVIKGIVNDWMFAGPNAADKYPKDKS
jgi:hypothetical protein